ncbi:recombinase family protein [Methylocystis echinoides]|nr:recombinase family protein [Methylocystis echinoides]
MLVRAYLRASTDEQDANRAKGALKAFATEHGLKIAGFYAENESGASLKRPELFRLLADCEPGDVLLTEQVDRLSRLNAADWEMLKAEIANRQIRVIALDLPTSWAMARPDVNAFTERMFSAVNAMLLDMLAAISRKDYEDRRRRQREGIQKAKSAGAYKGRPVDEARNGAIAKMLEGGQSWSTIQKAAKCSRSTIARIAAQEKEAGRHESSRGGLK